jgi:2-polyprenyl-3-methyl-5-hydroxy-6-metoxy-1,4-benzoquinol methylase
VVSERELALKINREVFKSDKGFGIGPYQDALIEFRCQTALEHFGSSNFPILDVGTGQGFVPKKLSSNGITVVGIDIGKKRMQKTSTTMEGEYSLAIAQRLSFPNNSFGGVIAFDVLEHLPEEDGPIMLQEIYRVLMPNGLIVLTTINTGSIAGITKRGLRKITGNNKLLTRRDHFNEVSYKQLVGVIEDCNFKIEELRGIGLVPFMWQVQQLFPERIHQRNINIAKSLPQISSEVLVVARKEP